ncbi:MAG: TlpA family protein disulfide reductase [Acidobacteriia bacterium]|nr:TlpA family protein disulfide reductase [Terriglobia bacterium]
MSVPACATLLPLLFAAAIHLGAETRFAGTVDQRLMVVDGSWATLVFKSAADADLQSLPSSADRSGPAYAGRLPETNIRLVITDHPANGAIVYADLNSDGEYSRNEQFPLHRLPGNALFTADTRGWPTQKTCFEVPIAGKSLGLRASTEGEIDFLSHSPETAFAEKEQIVFRAGDLYLSTESVDLKQRSVVLRSHPAGDYVRVELGRGVALPDWTFVDLKGRPGNLKSYAGKYVMLDVWTASCGPCLGEFDLLQAVVQRFGSRNFEILGVLGDADEAQARRAEEERRLPWRTAASRATLEYVERRLRIASWPTHILLDPDGRIISISDTELRGEALSRTLQALLPR